MSGFVEEIHCDRLVLIQIGIVATHRTCDGLHEEFVAGGYCQRFRGCIWLAASLQDCWDLGSLEVPM